MLYNGETIVRNFISESNARILARKYNDNSFRSTELSIIREACNRMPLNESLILEYDLNKNEIMALQLISERTGADHEIILLEFFGAIKKLGKKIGAAIAEPFKKGAKARKQGASTWQTLKYASTALPSLFKHGTHFGQGKATEKAKAAYQSIIDDFEKSTVKELKDLKKACDELAKTDFPNNPRPEDFRMALFGGETFEEIEGGNLGGILGKMLEIRETLQQMVGSGFDKKKANQIIEKMRGILSFHLGEMHDTYQSLENRDNRGNLIRSANVSLSDMYFDNDYWYGKVCEAAMRPLVLEDFVKAEQQVALDDAIEGVDEKQAEQITKETEKMSEEEFAQAVESGGDVGDLSANFKSMKASASFVRPLVIAAIGAAAAALGFSLGGSLTGDWENSAAMKSFLDSISTEKSISHTVTTIPEKAAEYFNIVEVKGGEGITQLVARLGGFSKDQIQNMSMGDFLKACKETGINPQTMGGLMEDPKAGFEFMKMANPSAKVGDYLKGVVELQRAAGDGVSEQGMGFLKQIFNSGSPLAKANINNIGKIMQNNFPGAIGKGLNPLSLKKGIGKQIMKKAGQAAKKKVVSYTYKTFAASQITGTAIAGVALPTILATAGAGVAASALAVAVLRKVAKNRKKTMIKAVELLTDIEGPLPGDPITQPNTTEEEGGPIDGTPPSDDEIASLDDQLPLDLFKRSLKDKGYDKEEELADEMFKDPTAIAALVQDTPPKPQSLTAGYRRELRQMSETLNRWSELAGLLTEDMDWEDFVPNVQKIAKDAGLPEPNEEQLGFGAQALNVTRGIGDVNNMPGVFKKEEFENKINELTIIIENLKLENSEAVRAMLDKLAMKVGLDPKNYEDLENDEYMEKLGETWNNDQEAWEDAMEEIEDLKGQLAAAHAKLDEKEAELAQSIAKIDDLVDENGQLIGKNKKLKGKLKKLKGKLEKKDIKIDDLKSTLKDKDKLLKLNKKEKSELQRLLDEATSELTGLKEREAELSSRVLDLRKFYLALSKVSGSNKTTYDTKHPQKKRAKNIETMAKAFKGLGDEFPALKDTGEILQRSLDAGINTSVAGSGQLKKGGGRNEPEARSKKDESSWRKGDLIMEKLKNL